MEQNIQFEVLLKLLEKDLIILPDKSEENAENTLRALWHLALGNHISPIVAEKLDVPALNSDQIDLLKELISSRLSGVPLAHITGRQHFMGLDFILNKGLYIPRKETELLAKTAIETIKCDFSADHNIIIIDLCTGIGTIALAIAEFCKNVTIFGSDIYEPAIIAAKINAQNLKLEDRATFYHADLFDPFESTKFYESLSLIVCNPPYISTSKVKEMKNEIANYENEEAFDAGPLGFSIFNQLISNAPKYLQPNGYLIFECGLGQGDFLANRITKNQHFSEVTKIYDENGNVRVVKAKKVN